jgi:hypothetical protein
MRAAAWVTVLLALPAAPIPRPQPAPLAAAVDLAGSWKIDWGRTPRGRPYVGRIEITPLGDCWRVEYRYDDGTSFTGVGMVVRDVIFAVAWTNDLREGGYGVALYATDADAGGVEGWWCQPDGRHGEENLGPPAELAGTHQIRGGEGSVRIARLRGSKVTYEMAWDTPDWDYPGFGMELEEGAGMIASLWGIDAGGGVAIYGLRELSEGKLHGWWANTGDTRQGEEVLKRR